VLKCRVFSLTEQRKPLTTLETLHCLFRQGKLPGFFVKNAKSTIVHGVWVIDNIATWIAEGYAAGQFDGLPCTKFRVNPFLAVVKPDKVRLCSMYLHHMRLHSIQALNPLETESIMMVSAKKLLLDSCSYAVILDSFLPGKIFGLP
jgi:hypothetical protein